MVFQQQATVQLTLPRPPETAWWPRWLAMEHRWSTQAVGISPRTQGREGRLLTRTDHPKAALKRRMELGAAMALESGSVDALRRRERPLSPREG